MNEKTRIGRFVIGAPLGSGGMGEVYRATDTLIDREVALKVLPPEFARDAELRERFLREAKAAGRLQHPNIVVIYEMGEDASRLYIAMEYLVGQSLAQVIGARSPGVSLEQKLQWIAQVARGLHYAHEHGVIHRDVKPANIMVTSDGAAKVVDFGIARAEGLRGGLTRTGMIVGTVFYMSPEQAQGKPVDRRSDIFSLGCVLYELLTNNVPFEGTDTVSTLYKIVHEPPVPLANRMRVAPPELEVIVALALRKQPEQRYATALEFAQALERMARSSEPTRRSVPLPPTTIIDPEFRDQPTAPSFEPRGYGTKPAPAPMPGPPPRPSASWWTSSTLKYAFTLIFAALIGGGWWMYRSATAAPPTGSSHSIETRPTVTPSPTPSSPGPAQPPVIVTISPQVTSRIDSIASVGQEIKWGDVLVQLNAQPFKADMMEAQGEKTNAAVAGDYARAREADAAYKHARDNVAATTIRAPFDCVVKDVLIDVGGLAPRGTPVLRIERRRGTTPDAPSPSSDAAPTTPYYVQTAATGSPSEADTDVAVLRKLRYPAFVLEDDTFRVLVGPFAAEADAEKIRDRLHAEGFNNALVRKPRAQ